ncbi:MULTISPECIES: hypothetical protein [Cellulophaga]|uniref:Uncharacterized protein n=1 Tax=Cellulophaga lytica (strain ATCC 23178 / DSM 7489 / JCM 8516 / NBRC 14961 / NCIMB 1423 / VKM B-1433 / Cy l20) TaxID=867900 RepID=F0RFE1_CELLC|nr:MULTISPECIES: hypothetical protein [Cellulophaga]ADY27883.1 hypothetical protein Celly_0048 [Cellulophaga lytica DSM 7489]APU08770.1 hypothetical protein A5M85_00235 [Cellulophaga lytica]MDO6853034.1 hypothetical protein [Cellulophaga lytica]TVZ09544.1 hypothetical protein JM80_2071 [Cellulophaga sp. RHA_52]WQG77925.1 hypothetical protein SR888_03145 [Cellulophaga lytica]
MKAIITLLFIITVGVTAQAQEAKVTPVLKMETTEVKATVVKKEAVQQETKVARLYKFKNSKIKKALSFSTKRGKSKIA